VCRPARARAGLAPPMDPRAAIAVAVLSVNEDRRARAVLAAVGGVAVACGILLRARKHREPSTEAPPAGTATEDWAPPAERVVYVMRGISGAGKSTRAKQILSDHLSSVGAEGLAGTPTLARAFLLSTDDFFQRADPTTGREVYTFDPSRIGENHRRNVDRCAIAMQVGVTPVIVDNTNTQLWEMTPYVELAQTHGYRIEICDVLRDDPSLTVETLVERCAKREAQAPGKSIPSDVLKKQWNGYQPLPADPAEAIAAILAAVSPFAPPKPPSNGKGSPMPSPGRGRGAGGGKGTAPGGRGSKGGGKASSKGEVGRKGVPLGKGVSVGKGVAAAGRGGVDV